MGRKLVFDTHGNDKQKLAYRYWIDDVTFDLVYGGSKGSGKSYLGVSVIFNDAMMYPSTHYFIARKQLNDIRKFTIPTINEYFEHQKIGEEYYKFNGQDNYYRLYNGSMVYLLEAKYMPTDPLYMRFGSMQMTRGMIEEAGEFEEEAKNNLAASIGRWKNDVYDLPGKLIQTCNPSKNYLYRDYYKPNREGTLPEWRKFIQALPTDNKMLPKGYIQNLERTLSKTQKQRLLQGNWEYDDNPYALIGYEKITDLFVNQFDNKGERYITCDVARFGTDRTVIIVWDGLHVKEIFAYPTTSTADTVYYLNEKANLYQVSRSNIIVDEDGVGGGVVDNLPGCQGFVNNSRPLHGENYENIKTQCYYKLAEYVNEAKITIHCNRELQGLLIEELEQVIAKDVDKDRKVKILSKEEIKANIGRSPDISDALMMRMVRELIPESWAL